MSVLQDPTAYRTKGQNSPFGSLTVKAAFLFSTSITCILLVLRAPSHYETPHFGRPQTYRSRDLSPGVSSLKAQFCNWQ